MSEIYYLINCQNNMKVQSVILAVRTVSPATSNAEELNSWKPLSCVGNLPAC